jgi:hypothetical protein
VSATRGNEVIRWKAVETLKYGNGLSLRITVRKPWVTALGGLLSSRPRLTKGCSAEKEDNREMQTSFIALRTAHRTYYT